MNERERAFRDYLEQFTEYSEQGIDLAVEWVRHFYRELAGREPSVADAGAQANAKAGAPTSGKAGVGPATTDAASGKKTAPGGKGADENPGSLGAEIARFERRIAQSYTDQVARSAGDAVRHFLYFSRRFDVTQAIDEEAECARILREVRERLRLKHRSQSTERSYIGWIERFLRHAGTCDRKQLDERQAHAFLAYLAVERQVAAATQQQCFNALLFLFRAVLGKTIDGLAGVVRSKRPQRLPVVLDPGEVRALLDALDDPYRLMCSIMYASGLRLRECLQIRISDVDVSNEQLAVRGAKGDKDRSALLPATLHQPIETQMTAASLSVHRRPATGPAGGAVAGRARGEKAGRGETMGVVLAVSVFADCA